MGAGPRTGRGLGYCSGYNTPGFANQMPNFRGGYGFGGRGGGRGWRNRYYATGVPGWVSPTPEQEVADLKAQADWLRGQLEAIQKRIDDIGTK